MPADKKFRLQLLESRKAQASDRKRDRVARAKPETSARAVLRSLKETAGAEDILERVSDFGELALWQEIAYFSVCGKSGSARWLDIWDADHFDGFTDMQRCVNDCRAWFSADGFATWGLVETKIGRVNCYFNALNIRRNKTTPINVFEWVCGVSTTLEDAPAAYGIAETKGNTLTIQARFSTNEKKLMKKGVQVRAVDPSSNFGGDLGCSGSY